MASRRPRRAACAAVRPVPPKTAKSRPQPPKSAIESHLRFAESFRVHGPISMSEFAALNPAPPSGWSGGTLDIPWTCPGTIKALKLPFLISQAYPNHLLAAFPRRNDSGAVQTSGRWVHGAHGSMDLVALNSAGDSTRRTSTRSLSPADQTGAQALLNRADEQPLAQNSLPTARPRTLSGPWSSRPSVAWSSFCNVSFAFL